MMGIFGSLLSSPKKALDINNEQLWSTWIGPASSAGVTVTAETARTLSAFWACERLISTSMANMPCFIYRRGSDTDRERASYHPLYDVLHRQANRYQSAYEFVRMLTSHVILRGNGYARIIAGPRGPVDQLLPLHPDRMRPEQLENGAIRYQYTPVGRHTETLTDDEVFHLRGPSDDGVTGLALITYMRESAGLGIAAERYGARFFGNDSRPGGVLQHPGNLSNDAATRLRDSWEDAHRGANQNRVAVLEEGLEWKQVGIAPEDAQFLQTREFQVEEIARWFGVPLHMIQMTSKSTSWGTGIEQQQLGFLMFTMLSYARLWETTINKDLILAPQTYYAEFLLDALVRADLKTRFEVYVMGRNSGLFSVNDVLRKENMPIIAGGDDHHMPMNMMRLTDVESYQAPASAGPAPGGAHYWQLLNEAAGRIIRKERAALTKAASRCNGDGPAWATTVTEFFGTHGRYVAEVLGLPELQGKLYATERQNRALELGSAGITALWNDHSVPALAQMAALASEEIPDGV